MNTENLDAILVYLGSLVERTDKWSAQALPILGREVVLKGLITSGVQLFAVWGTSALFGYLSYVILKRHRAGNTDENADLCIIMCSVVSFCTLLVGFGPLMDLLHHIFAPNAVLLDYVMTKLGK